MGNCCSVSDEDAAANKHAAAAPIPRPSLMPSNADRDTLSSDEQLIRGAGKYGRGASKLMADVLGMEEDSGSTIDAAPAERGQLGIEAHSSVHSVDMSLKTQMLDSVAHGGEIATELLLTDPISLQHFRQFLENSQNFPEYIAVLELAVLMHRRVVLGEQCDDILLTGWLDQLQPELQSIVCPDLDPALSAIEVAEVLLADDGLKLMKLVRMHCMDTVDYECIGAFRVSAEMRQLVVAKQTAAFRLGDRFVNDLQLQAFLLETMQKFLRRIGFQISLKLFEFLADVLRVNRKADQPPIQAKLMQEIGSKYLHTKEGLNQLGFSAYLDSLPAQPTPSELSQLFQAVLAHLQQHHLRAFLMSAEYAVFLEKQSDDAAFHAAMAGEWPEDTAESTRASTNTHASTISNWLPPSEDDSMQMAEPSEPPMRRDATSFYQ